MLAAVTLTKRDGQTYPTYPAFIDRVRGNPLAREVKLADIEDNLDQRRLSRLPLEEQNRLQEK